MRDADSDERSSRQDRKTYTAPVQPLVVGRAASKPPSGTMPSVGITTTTDTTALALGPPDNQHICPRGKEHGFVYKGSSVSTSSYFSSEQGFVYKDSSVPVSSHSSSNIEDARSSNGLISPQRMNYDSSSSGGRFQGSLSKDDDEVDDQQSTEPVPADFDYHAMFASSPQSCTRQDAPITRARARAQALNQTENDNLVNSTYEIKNPKPKSGTYGYQLPPFLSRRDTPTSRAKRRVPDNHECSVDGSGEGHISIDEEGSASSAPETENPKLSPDDDEHHFPESGNNNDNDDEYLPPESENGHDNSEMSVINEIIGHPRKTTSKKTVNATYSSRSKGKQVAKAKTAPITAKKIRRPATNKTTGSTHKQPVLPNKATSSLAEKDLPQDTPSPVRQMVQNSAGSGDQEASDVIPDSQAAFQELAGPPKARLRGYNSRRPKQPFYPPSLGCQQVKQQPAPSVHSITDTHQRSTERQGKVKSSSPNETEIWEDREIQTTNPKKHGALDIPQPESSRGKSNNSAKLPVNKRKGRAIGHSHPIVTVNQINKSPIPMSSDQHSQLTDAEYQGVYIQSSPYRMEVETTKRPGNSELSEQPIKKIKIGPATGKLSNNADASTQGHLPQLSSSPAHCYHMREAKNEATQTEIFEAEPFPHDLYHQERQEKQEKIVGNDTTRYRFLRSPRAHDTSGISWGGFAATTARKERQREEELEHLPSLKASRALSDTEESLHPNSIAWAHRIAEKSRQKNLVSVPLALSEEIQPLGRTPIMTQEDGKNEISKRETTLAARRDAVFESVQEVTTAMLQHLQSKESVANEIVDTYQQNGRKLIDRLLDRQSNELHEVISAFDGKCVRLRNMFNEATHHVDTVRERASKRDDEFSRAWEQRSKELDEHIKMVWEVVASI